MELTWNGCRFEARSKGAVENALLKEAGFHYDYQQVRWWTGRIDVAKRFEQYADYHARARFTQDAQQIALSRALDSNVNIPAPDGLSYLGFQKAGISFILQRRNTLLADEMGLGKAQSVTCKVVTEDGWKQIGDLEVGDKIYGPSGQLTEITGIYPQGLKEVFKVTFTDGVSTECCDEHLWAVSSADMRFNKEEPRVRELSEIRSKLYDAAGNKRHFIPLTFPVLFPERELPLDPYLLGVLLGDGCIKYSTDFCSADSFIVDEVKHIVAEMDLVVRQTGCNNGIDYRICQKEKTWNRNILKEKLQLLGMFGHGSETKFIPDIYLIASLPQRIALIQGLLDTDGYVSKEGTIQFSSISKKLADGFAELVYSVGGIARVNPYSYQYKDNPEKTSYVVTTSLPEGIPPFRLPRKLERVKQQKKYKPYRAFKSVESVGIRLTVCIKVKAIDQLYLTDNYIVTHNTIQAIGAINGHPAIKRILITPPASLRINWMRELMKWSVKKLTGGFATSTELPDTDIVIANYDIMYKLKEKIQKRKWDMHIMDEGHYLKSPTARRTKACLGYPGDGRKKENAELPIDCGMRIIATGTPILNRPIELWPFLRVMDPTGLGSSHWNYAKKYCGAWKAPWGRWEFNGHSHLDELQDRLRATIMIRRLKKDVLRELPAKRRQVITLPADKKDQVAIQNELAFYDSHSQEIEKAVRDAEHFQACGDEESYQAAIDQLKKEKKVLFEEMARLRLETALKKVPYVIEYLNDILEDVEKIVVFAHHKSVINQLHEAFPNNSVWMHGDVSVTERQARVDRFMSDNKVRIIFGSIGTMGVGWTLTQASYCLFVELDWVPAWLSQAEDRLHRIGQTESVLIHHVVFDGSLDANMAERIIEKQIVIEEAVG